MSLVIALIADDRIHISADLRVTQPDILPEEEERQTPHLFNGILKIIPIRPELAICYAGTVPIALDIIRKIAGTGMSTSEIPGKIIEYLENDNNVNECDFLVIDAAQKVVHKISEGRLTSLANGRTWIGDIRAYELLQEKLEDKQYGDSDNPIQKAVKIMNSLQDVINERSVESVGEFPISAHSHRGEIQLSVGFSAQGSRIPIGNRQGPISFSNDTNDDALIVNLTVPMARGVAAIGMYLTQARRGALYMPLVQDQPFLVEGDSLSDFRANVLKIHGIELQGGGFE
ncbi:hypothetical protein KY385_04650 [Candidatus Parcubacteria bacterium]|nr:hypothetical protein [Candidatus Parcubacteria bacterium]